MELVEKKARSQVKSKSVKDELATGNKVLELLDSERRVFNGEWTNNEVEIINSMALLTAKPSVYIANVSEDAYVDYVLSGYSIEGNQRLKDIQKWIDENSPGDALLPVSVSLEERLNQMETEEERLEELELLEVPSALPGAIVQLRKSLNLISYYTCGPVEVREWTIRKVKKKIKSYGTHIQLDTNIFFFSSQGVKAPGAAAVIHNDLAKTFIQAQVSKFEDVVAAEGKDTVLKAEGKVLQKGKDYVVEDGDVIYFKVSVLSVFLFNTKVLTEFLVWRRQAINKHESICTQTSIEIYIWLMSPQCSV